MFDRFRAPLLRYLSGFGIGYADAEEIIQETFLSLFQHLESGKRGENLRGWIFRVAHNLAIRHRARVVQANHLSTVAAIEQVAVDPALNPESRLAVHQVHQHVLAAVEALPDRDRHCLYLRAEGFRYRDIARILNLSLGGVALSLSKTLSRLARCAERYHP